MVASLIYFFVKVAVDHSSIKTTALRWNMDWWMSQFCGNQCVCFLAFPFRGNRKQHCTVDSRGKNCTCFAPLPFSFIGSSVASLPATGGMAKQLDAGSHCPSYDSAMHMFFFCMANFAWHNMSVYCGGSDFEGFVDSWDSRFRFGDGAIKKQLVNK